MKGTEASLPYVQCFLYLVRSSKNVSIFHITWLDTFWTDLVHWETNYFTDKSVVLRKMVEKSSRCWNILGISCNLQENDAALAGVPWLEHCPITEGL